MELKIVAQYPDIMSAKDKYDLMRSPKTQRMQDMKGQRLEVSAYMIREETNGEGEVSTIVSVKTKDGDLVATNSKTFLQEFEAIIQCVGASEFSLDVLDGVSRAGRHYVTCAWAD